MTGSRRLRAGLVTLLAAVLLWGCTGPTPPASPTGAGAVAPIRLSPIEVAPKVWFVQGEAALGSRGNRNFISNAGFVLTSEGAVVIDALGSPALAQALIAEIRKRTPLPIQAVIVTHYHADHIYGLQAFKDAGATVIAHKSGQEYLGSETAQRRLEASREELAPWIDANTRLVPADRWLEGEETRLTFGDTSFVVRHVGAAHTPEDLVVFVPSTGALFAGDLFFRGRIPFVGTADSRQWIASLEKLLSLGARVVVPGHGPQSTDPKADMTLTRDYLVHLRRTMGEAAKNLEPFEDAYKAADWSRFAGLPLFNAANRINAYNTFLLMEQQGGQ